MSSPPPSPTPASPSADAGALASELRSSLLRVSRRLRRERPADGVSDAQHAVLAVLSREGVLTPSALAAQEGVKPPSMTRVLDALEAAGLLERSAHPSDRRQVLVGLTGAGRHHVSETRRRRDAWLSARLEDLTPGQRELLARASGLLLELVSDGGADPSRARRPTAEGAAS